MFRHEMASTVASLSVLQAHLHWDTAHVVGHSMGGMIAMKLAVLAPERVCSLSIISATGGGWQSLPFSWRAAKYMWKVCSEWQRQQKQRNRLQKGIYKSPSLHWACLVMQAYRAGSGHERAKVDLKFHFMRETLRQYVRTVRFARCCTFTLACALLTGCIYYSRQTMELECWPSLRFRCLGGDGRKCCWKNTLVCQMPALMGRQGSQSGPCRSVIVDGMFSCRNALTIQQFARCLSHHCAPCRASCLRSGTTACPRHSLRSSSAQRSASRCMQCLG